MLAVERFPFAVLLKGRTGLSQRGPLTGSVNTERRGAGLGLVKTDGLGLASRATLLVLKRFARQLFPNPRRTGLQPECHQADPPTQRSDLRLASFPLGTQFYFSLGERPAQN